MPMTGGSSFTLTFPATLTVIAAPTVTPIENLNAGMTTNYDSISRLLTVTTAVAVGASLDEGQSIALNISTITSPSNTAPTASIEYRSFDSSGGAIEICDTGISITATPGLIDTATAVPVDTTVNVLTDYTITFTTESIIPNGAILYIGLPPTITTSNTARS